MSATAIDLRTHAREINEQHRDCVTSYGHALSHAFRAGALLIEVKEQVGHGNLLAWIAEHCEFSDRTARVYMQVASAPELIDRQSPAEMSISQTLKQISKPREPKPEHVSAGEMGNVFAANPPAPNVHPDSGIARDLDQARERLRDGWTEQQMRKRERASQMLREAMHLAESLDRLSSIGIAGVAENVASLCTHAANAWTELAMTFEQQ